MNRYFATVTAGLERVAWSEIVARAAGARLLRFGHRVVFFETDRSPQILLGLRAVDDVLVFVGELTEIGATRAALPDLRDQVATFDLLAAAEVCRAVRPLPEQPSYAITASFVGSRTYSRYEIAAALAEGIETRSTWRYVENTPESHADHDLDLRVLLEGERGLVGLRLALQPLHRRPYKLASRPGSLKAPVAYALALLAGVAPGERVLDPCCGVGTIALEAARLSHPAPALASDMSREAVADARVNAAGSAFTPLLFVADATALPFPDASIDVVASNLPFGRQVATTGDLGAVYAAIVAEVARVLRPNGRAALLTDQNAAFMAALRAQPTLRLHAAHQISLFGLHPVIYLIETQNVTGLKAYHAAQPR